ncbi:outer membrane usher protein CssD (CS6 fimbria usherprotein) [Escherichia coli TA054]|nr:outer membrane usher protein CssD (CS6 fimbria usherprotein) [Escherichia coli TA054]
MLTSVRSYGQAQYSFDPRFLPEGVDISSLSVRPPEGRYLVDIYVNGQFKEVREVSFSRQKTQDALMPCLNSGDLYRLGIRTENSDTDDCVDLQTSQYNTVAFNFSMMELKLTVPQQSLFAFTPTVSAQDIDDGIPAILLNYQGGTRLSRHRGRENRNDYLNLTPGVNIGSWRYRNRVSYTKAPEATRWRGTYGALERGFFDQKSRLIVGEHYVQSTLYDSYLLRGIQLFTDEGMYSSSELEYTPVVEGVADSDSQVIIRQSGVILLSESVPAGPFRFPVSGALYSGGELDVEVIGINGNVKQYTVYNASLPVMLKQGALKYGASVGQMQGASEKHLVSQGEVFYGIGFNSTLYGGYQAGADFLALTLGLGTDLGVAGALAADVTGSKRQGEPEGASYTVKYSKKINVIDSSITASLMHQDQSHSTLSDSGTDGFSSGVRRRFSLSLWKSLKGFGSVSVNVNDTRYQKRAYDNQTTTLRHQFGLWGGFVSTSYSVSREMGRARSNKFLGLNLLFPLGAQKKHSLNYAYSRTKAGRINHTLGLSGQGTENGSLTYAFQQTISRTRGLHAQKSSYASATYFSPYGVYTGSYMTSGGASSQYYSASGGVLLHGEGVDLVQRIGETTALVSVDSVAGVKVGAYPGVSTNFRGFAATPWLQAYRRNHVVLNEKETPENVTLMNIRKITTPSRGAISRLRFDAQQGKNMLITLTLRNGRTPPLGAIASVKNARKTNTGIVDSGGSLYMSGLNHTDKIVVKWGEKQCEFSLTVDDFSASELSLVSKTCR